MNYLRFEGILNYPYEYILLNLRRLSAILSFYIHLHTSPSGFLSRGDVFETSPVYREILIGCSVLHLAFIT